MNHLQFKSNNKVYFDTRNSLIHPMLIYSQCFLAAYVVFIQHDLVKNAVAEPLLYMVLRLFLILLVVFVFAYCTHKIKIPKRGACVLLLLFSFFTPFLFEVFLSKSLDCPADSSCANNYSKIVKYNLIPIVATFLAVLIKIERFTPLKIIGIVLSALATLIPLLWGLMSPYTADPWTLPDYFNMLQCVAAGLGLVCGRILLANFKMGVVNTIFWSYLIASAYTALYLLLYPPDGDRFLSSLKNLGSIHRYLGILYFLALLLLFKDLTITWSNKHAEVSKVSFYSSLQPICMAIFYSYFTDDSHISTVHLVASAFALLGYIIIFSQKQTEASMLKAQKKRTQLFIDDLGQRKSKAMLLNKIEVQNDFFYGEAAELRKPSAFSEDTIMLFEGDKEFGILSRKGSAGGRGMSSIVSPRWRRKSLGSEKLTPAWQRRVHEEQQQEEVVEEEEQR